MPTAPTVNSGIRSTTVGLASDRRVVDMRDRIYDYDPDASPFLTVLSRRLSSVKSGNPTYNHLEDQPLPWWDLLGGSVSAQSGTQNITITNYAYFRAGDICLIPSSSTSGGEYVKVLTTPTSTTMSVTRDYISGGTGGTASSGAYIAIIGNVNEEHATKRTIKSTAEATVTNYTQIFRDPFGGSNTAQASTLYGGKERTRQRKKQATQHNLARERAFLFGKKKLGTGANGHAERATGGLLQWVTANVTNVNGTLTDQVLETWCQSLFRYGSKSRLVIGSRLFASQLDMIGANRLQTVPRADTYGVAVKEFISAHGSLMVAISDTLINSYAGYAFAIDLENVMQRHMEDDDGPRDSRLRTNIQDPSADGWEDEYLSEQGLHVMLSDTHGYLYGIA